MLSSPRKNLVTMGGLQGEPIRMRVKNKAAWWVPYKMIGAYGDVLPGLNKNP